MEWIDQLVSNSGALWHGLGSDTKAALIGAVGTCLAAFFGFGGLICQIRSQGRLSNAAIAENERRKVKAKMFEDSIVITRELVDKGISLSTQLRTMKLQLEIAARAHSVNVGFPIPAARISVLSSGYSDFADAAHRYIFLIENSRFIDTRILVFRTAISTVLHDTMNIFYREFPLHLMPSLPVERPDGGLFDYQPPSIEGFEKIAELTESVLSSLGDATAYTEDFMVEMQNHLIGDLFRTQVDHRIPIDPQCKVVTLENSAELEAWFSKNTNWGREMARIDEETRQKFGVDTKQPVSEAESDQSP